MTGKYICTLPASIKECQYRKDDMSCTINNEGCGFRVKEEKSDGQQYVRPNKWFEKYYKK